MTALSMTADPISGIEKLPLERYVAPAKPSLVGMSRPLLAQALADIGVPPRSTRCGCSSYGTGSTCAAPNPSMR